MRLIMGIDPGTHRMGIGIITTDGDYYRSMVIRLREGEIYERAIAMTRAVLELIESLKHPIVMIGIEDQVIGRDSRATIWLARTTGMIAYVIHEQLDILPVFVHPSTLKSFMKISNSKTSRSEAVEWMIEHFQIEPETDDEAFALGIAQFLYENVHPKE